MAPGLGGRGARPRRKPHRRSGSLPGRPTPLVSALRNRAGQGPGTWKGGTAPTAESGAAPPRSIHAVREGVCASGVDVVAGVLAGGAGVAEDVDSTEELGGASR